MPPHTPIPHPAPFRKAERGPSLSERVALLNALPSAPLSTRPKTPLNPAAKPLPIEPPQPLTPPSGTASAPFEPFLGEVPFPARHFRGWATRFPWLLHGITVRGPDAPFDLRLRGPAPSDEVLARWDALLGAPGFHAVVHARQVHEATIRAHRGLFPGFLMAPSCDGHFTAESGVLLTVSVADCVPIYLVSEGPRGVALLHAGWRGAAAGILERGIERFQAQLGVRPGALHLMLGPSISAAHYEVGPEVHDALTGSDPGQASLLDLRGHLWERALALGVLAEHLVQSTDCVFEDPAYFSHRGGCSGRQVAFLGLRDPSLDLAPH